MRVIRFFLGCALLPLAVAVVWLFVDVFQFACGSVVTSSAIAVFAGFLLQLVLWCLVVKPVRAYVLGHELTHALCGLCFGARATNLKVGLRGGSVTLTKTNVLITLAPYFFPFYTVAVVLVALLVRLCVASLPCPLLWLFLVGYTWSFHVAFTLQGLFQRQPDIEEYGHLFSYVFIWIANVLGVVAVLACTTEVSWRFCGNRLITHVGAAYMMVGRWTMWLYESVRSLSFLQG